MARKPTLLPEQPQSQERTKRRLAELTPHPNQDDWFPPLSELELQALADSMERDGLQHPIHILPDGTILVGHQRVAAATLNGWKEIDVIVRHDLAGDETAAAMFALTDNINRRQMGPLEMARAYRALIRLERQDPQERHNGNGMDLRDRLAVHFGKSGRQLDRYLRLLDLPAPIRIAISQRRLPVSAAEKLFVLDREELQQAADQMERGHEPWIVVRRFVPDQPKQHRFAKNALTSFLKHLEHHVPDLHDRVKDMALPDSGQIELLERAQNIISTIVKNSKRKLQV